MVKEITLYMRVVRQWLYLDIFKRISSLVGRSGYDENFFKDGKIRKS